ncbi:MAG: response regulator transcription factor [Rhizobacter sp.]|nr:response regulator transcription factor [Ferruginibacter sp.]
MKLLIVEDEIQLSKSMATYLLRQGYTCDIAYDYKEGLDKMDSFEYDCILLDISLPGGSGLQLLKNLKADNKLEGVIIISAKDAIDEKIEGLNLGADDYMPKPFHLSELNARVAAVIRRKKFQGSSVLVFNELTIDLLAKTVLVNNKPVDISKKEYDLLLYLVSSKNRVISKNAIAENISGDGVDLYDNFDFIYAHIKNLKRKLTAAGCDDYIKSVYGMGYKFTI